MQTLPIKKMGWLGPECGFELIFLRMEWVHFILVALYAAPLHTERKVLASG